ncbi:AraC family transcriptional regulator [Flavobacterium rhizosphaerae]|uniref:AraC family transcriptional regulator n=1 Tax=Flavobacterium rhizosphaerae TaxID=3163298 RepID=A0ABW8YZT6_9FLAO
MQLTTETNIPVYTLKESSYNGAEHFEIVKGEALTTHQKELFFVPHRNNFYKFVFVKSGQSKHWIDMVPYVVKPNAFYFSSPQQIMLKEESTCSRVIGICFTDEFLNIEDNRVLRQLPIIQNPNYGHELLLSEADVAFIDDISEKILEEYNRGDNWRNSMLTAYMQVLLIYMSRLYTAQVLPDNATTDRELFKKFSQLIEENIVRVHDVAGYAAMVNLSAGHFSELIKEQSGKTAMQHIHDRLLLEAKRLLFHTDTSVKEIAYQLGFEDASYFNRFFKRLTESTPAAYRTAVREMYH